MLKTCSVCAGEFHGRADAVYCSPACRQKSYRARSKEGMDSSEVGDGFARADVLNWMTAALRPDWIDNYLPLMKLHMIGLLTEALGDLERSAAKDEVTAAEARKIARRYRARSQPLGQ